MSKKLFVGGLSWNTTEEGLRGAFEPFGDLQEVKIIMDRDTGRSKGFGFVTFSDESAAERAREELSGTDLDGRTIRVDEAHDRRDRGGGGGGGGGGRGGGGGNRW